MPGCLRDSGHEALMPGVKNARDVHLSSALGEEVVSDAREAHDQGGDIGCLGAI